MYARVLVGATPTACTIDEGRITYIRLPDNGDHPVKRAMQ